MTDPGTTSTGVASSERPLRRTGLTVHELDGEALIFNAATNDTHRLNRTAYFIWQCCDGAHDLADITHRMTETFEVSEESAETHARNMIELLHERSLLTEAGR
jgi:PqqD family protein of HPr-rel-A system